ncbi:Scr1 family TA system antitoxin-like transcriptional regulator [Streptomyces sp. NPDC096310]|uniref:Scr1 family TA system antitoxin-like transcriptional regulator n=1 Tax=Streptomyces sp. NPDC096310 TaxID=3366082 RepID=UPI003827BF37
MTTTPGSREAEPPPSAPLLTITRSVTRRSTIRWRPGPISQHRKHGQRWVLGCGDSARTRGSPAAGHSLLPPGGKSKVSRIENGKQAASEAGIRTWCERTNTQEQVADLIATVRHIDELWLEWRRQFQDGAEKRQAKALPVYSKTKVFRVWHPTLIWGTLQTAEYAAETFKQVIEFFEIPDDTEVATAKRLERQRYLTQGNRIFNVLLAEQALYSNFGGPEVMRGQLDRLLAVIGLPRLSLGFIPRSAPLSIWPGNSFQYSTTSLSSSRPTPPNSP